MTAKLAELRHLPGRKHRASRVHSAAAAFPALLAVAWAPPVPGSPTVRRRLNAVRRKWVSTHVATGIAAAAGLIVLLMGAGMLLDWWMDLPRWVRALMLLGYMAVVVIVFLRYIYDPLVHPPDDDDVALMIEKDHPHLQTRLIAAVQLTRPQAIPAGSAVSLVRQLVRATDAIMSGLDCRRVVKTAVARRVVLATLLVGLAGGTLFYRGEEVSVQLLQRALLSNIPVPRLTRVVVLTGDRTIAPGDPVQIEALARGIVPASGRVEVRYQGRRPQNYPIYPDRESPARFLLSIDNVQQPFTYLVYLNDGRSDPHQIFLHTRPAVTAVDCLQEFPAYVNLPPVRRSTGELALLAGSTLRVRATANKNIQRAHLLLAGLKEEVPLRVNKDNPRELTGQFRIPAKGLTGFSIHLTDELGLQSRDEAVYRIDIVPDRSPIIRVLYPERREELVTQVATVLFAFEVTDDFGIEKMFFNYKIDSDIEGAEPVQRRLELDLHGQTPKTLRRRHEWSLTAFSPPLAQGSSIEYWLEAHDTNRETGPGISTSERRWARVVSETEKRAEMANRMVDTFGSMEAIADSQAELTRQLGDLIFIKPARP